MKILFEDENIVVCINSIDILNEVYNEIVEKYIPIIREGNKYGIYFQSLVNIIRVT